MKKKIPFIVVASVVTAILLAVNIVVLGPLQPIINNYFKATGEQVISEEQQAVLAQSDALVQNLSEDSIVLLKNEDDVLPLGSDFNKINVFGYGATDEGFLLKGVGSGSSTISNKARVTLLSALRDAGIQYNENIIRVYDGLSGVRTSSVSSSTVYNLNEPDVSAFNSLLADAKKFSSVALFVLSRDGGENVGEIPTSYLDITNKEQATLQMLRDNFSTVIVLLNTTNTMHCGFLADDTVDACLFVGLPGQSGARAIPSILKGYKTSEDGEEIEVCPSGKLSDTYVYSSSYEPSFADHEVASGSVQYSDDIYIGYKWYETADAENYFGSVTNKFGRGYDGVVQYPFGYGLSYTEFNWTVRDISLPVGSTIDENTKITVTVAVENVGSVSGKDTVQLYYTPKYIKGGIEKAEVNLVDFAKTETLEPGMSQTLTLNVTARDLASFDCYDRNRNDFTGYEIDAGEFTLSLRTDAHTIADCDRATLTYNCSGLRLATDAVTGNEIVTRLTGETAYTGIPIDGSNAGITTGYLSRNDFAGTFPRQHSPSPSSSAVSTASRFINNAFDADGEPATSQNANEFLFTLEGGGKANQQDLRGNGGKLVLNEQLVEKLSDYYSDEWVRFIAQMSASELKSLVELGGFRTVEVVSVGKPLFTDYDGPAGFNMNSLSGNWGGKAPDTSQWTAFPSEDLMGCSWNKSMMLQMGLSMGAEAANTGCNGWYAPGVNLHRSAYNARNYEYYSEDGVLSGYLAANVIKGAKINGLYCYLKHFACSEEGPNPRNVNTWLTEQNLRENYLRPFEIAVKEGGANAIMSAFNRVGAVWSGANYAMLTQILREEWGFKGSVITDWTDGQGIGGMNSTQGVRAGNDLWLNPYNSLNSGMSMNATDIACAQRSAKNIIYTYVDTYTFAKNFDRSELDSTLSFEVDLGSLKQTKDPFAWWNVVVFALDFLAVGGFALWAGFLFFPATDDGKLKKVGKMVKIAAIVILALTVATTSVVIPVGMASRAASSDQSANASDSSSNSGSKQTIDPNIQSIEISGNVVVTDGRPLTAASITVNARYKDGSVKALSKKQYELVNGSEVATIGKAGKISVKYGDLIAEKAYTVQKTLEGEDALLTGKGKTGTEDEYLLIDGQLVPAGTTTGFAGDFKNGDTLTFTLNSTLSAKANLTFRVASGYCVYVNGSNSSDGYLMRELKLNAILDIYVNGVKISIPDTVVLPEVGPSSNYAGLYNVYSEVSFDDVNLNAGVNQIRLAFVSGRNGEKNCWGSAVSNVNVDYMSVSSVGRAVDATATVTAIEIGDFTANIYDDYQAVNVPVLATMSNGEKMLLSSDEYDLTITGADTSATFFQGGNNYVTATLKGNSAITAQKTYVINAQKHIYIRTADVYEKNGRVYYAFSGVQYGYDNATATFRFFSDKRGYDFAEITVTPTSISFTIDVTDLENGIIYPHISMDGVNYPNDDNANGDIKNMGLRFNDGTSVTVNGRTYTLTDKWGMPCMVIS